MARPKQKVQNGSFEESTTSLGENDQDYFGITGEEGVQSRTSRDVICVDASSSLELLCDGKGNTGNQLDELDGAIFIIPLLVATPRLISLLKSFNEHLMHTSLSEQAPHETEVVLNNNALEVEVERLALGEVENPKSRV